MQSQPKTGSIEDEVRRLARTIEESRDAVVVCRAAFDLRACLTGPNLDRATLEAAAGAAASLGRRFLAGGDGSASAREAASEVVAALYDVVHGDPHDRSIVRGLLVAKPGGPLRSDNGLWPTLQGLCRYAGSGDGCDLAFVHACELLAALAAGHPHLCRALCGAGLLELAAGRLLRATNGRRGVPTVALLAAEAPEVEPMGEGWLFWATAAAWLLEVLLLEEDPAFLVAGVPSSHRPVWEQGGQPRQSQVVLDALVAALDRGLAGEHGHLVVQRLHVSCLRALGQIVRICRGQVFLSSGTHRSGKWQVEPAVRHLLASGVVQMAANILTLADSTDEQGTAVALWFLAELGEGAPTERDLRVREGYSEVAVAGLASRAISAYPRSHIVLREAQRVLRAAGASAGEPQRPPSRLAPCAAGDARAEGEQPGAVVGLQDTLSPPAARSRTRPGSTLTEGLNTVLVGVAPRGACASPDPEAVTIWKPRPHEPVQVLPRLKPLLSPILRAPCPSSKRPPSQTPRSARGGPWRAWQMPDEGTGDGVALGSWLQRS